MKLFLLFSAALGLFAQSCTTCQGDDEVAPATGISGQVLYGAGDCMPMIDEPARKYTPYTGELYFIQKTALDQLGNGSFDQLRSASLHYKVKDGQLIATPPADTYVVMPAEYYTNANVVTIVAGRGVRQDFKFWRCLVY